MAGAYNVIDKNRIPLDELGNSKVDLYVYLPLARRYIRYVCAGDPLDEVRAKKLQGHSVATLFVKAEDAKAPEWNFRHQSNDSTSEGSLKDSMSKKAEKDLTRVFSSMLDAGSDPTVILGEIEAQTDIIMDAIVPDVKDLRAHITSSIKSLALMNDVAGITSLAILMAMASGYDSKKSYRDLAYACLVMDFGLAEFGDDVIAQYYKDPTLLPAATVVSIKKHPFRSHELAQQKLKSLSDGTLQLILCHHELFNGRGYPRGIRYESLTPIVKVLCLAVDTFEKLKNAQLNDQKLSFIDALTSFQELDKDAHLRRQSRKLVDQIFKYVQTTAG